MSGQNRLIVSLNQGKSESAITSALENANEVVIKNDKKDAKKQEKKK